MNRSNVNRVLVCSHRRSGKIATYCRQGVHRSVGTLEILKLLFDNTDGFVVEEIPVDKCFFGPRSGVVFFGPRSGVIFFWAPLWGDIFWGPTLG